MQTISVMPANGGWQVCSDIIDNALMFRRGRTAERAAMRLAEARAATGELVRIEVHLPDGSVARRFICPSVDRRTLASDIDWRAPRPRIEPSPAAGRASPT
jgi:hypothetical protein